jgi:hypothetical protein
VKRIVVLLVVALMVGVAAQTAGATPVGHVTISSRFVAAGDLSSGTTTGTFCVSGALADCGALGGGYRFAGIGNLLAGQSDLIDANQTLSGRNGAIRIAIVGVYGPLRNAVTTGAGVWWVTGGTGAYAGLHGGGRWTATADFTAALAGTGPPVVDHLDIGELF